MYRHAYLAIGLNSCHAGENLQALRAVPQMTLMVPTSCLNCKTSYSVSLVSNLVIRACS